MIVGQSLQRGELQSGGLQRSLLHLSLCCVVLAAAVSSFKFGVLSAESEHSNGASTGSIAAVGGVESGTEVPSPAQWGVEAAAPDPGLLTPNSGLDTPNSTADAAAAKLGVSTYTVEPGDSLASIAQRFGIDVPTLLGSNDLDDPDLLPTGLELTVLPIRGVLYRVAEGDTLNRIAARYELAVRDIMQVNAIGDSELIAIGDALVLPGATPVLRAPPEVEPAVITPAGPATAARVEQPRAELAAAVMLPPPAAARPSFVWPAGGPITTYFGEVGWTAPRGHAGLDIAAPWGAPVRAAAAGQVIVSTRAGGPYGLQVIIDHGGGLRTVYGHLSELHVAAGERVEHGELIGLVGSTGFSTGPHLHFEIRQNGELRDPLRFLP